MMQNEDDPSLSLDIQPVDQHSSEDSDDESNIKDVEVSNKKPGSNKLYRVSAKLGDQEWTVFKKEEDLTKAGLKSWLSNFKHKAVSLKQQVMLGTGMVSLLDPYASLPPASTLVNPEKACVMPVFLPKSLCWSNLYVVLCSGILYIYRKEKSRAPVAVIDLVCSVVDQEKDIESIPLNNINSSSNTGSVASNQSVVTSPTPSSSTTSQISPKNYFYYQVKENIIYFDAGSEEEVKDWVLKSRKCRDLHYVNNTSFNSLRKGLNQDEVDRAIKMFQDVEDEDEEQAQLLLKFAQEQNTNYSLDYANGAPGRTKRANGFRRLRASMAIPNPVSVGLSSSMGGSVSPRKSPFSRPIITIRDRFAKSQVMNQSLVSTDKNRKDLIKQYAHLREQDSEHNILYVDGKLRAASLNKLIQHLCDVYVPHPDDSFMTTFLLTYHWFTTSNDLFETILEWWEYAELSFQGAEIHRTRERIGKVLIRWVELQWNEFKRSPDLTTKFLNFINEQTTNQRMSPSQANFLKEFFKVKYGQLLSSKDSKQWTSPPVNSTNTTTTTTTPPTSTTTANSENETNLTPIPILPQIFSIGSFGILDIDSVEIARQLTLVQVGLYYKLPFEEFVGQKWTKTDLSGDTPNIVNCIQRFNRISGWSTEYVLNWSTPQQRGYILSKLIDIAYECVKLKNFETVVQIVSGIENAAISRLKLTWQHVSPQSQQKLKDLRELFTPVDNWRVYRNELNNTQPPAIPYLGLYLQRLIFTEDGNPTFMAPHSLVNWNKCNIISSMLSEIFKYQQSVYHFTAIPQITALFSFEEYVGKSDKELFTISLQIETKESINEQLHNNHHAVNRLKKTQPAQQQQQQQTTTTTSNLQPNSDRKSAAIPAAKNHSPDKSSQTAPPTPATKQIHDVSTPSKRYCVDASVNESEPKRPLSEREKKASKILSPGGGGGQQEDQLVKDESPRKRESPNEDEVVNESPRGVGVGGGVGGISGVVSSGSSGHGLTSSANNIKKNDGQTATNNNNTNNTPPTNNNNNNSPNFISKLLQSNKERKTMNIGSTTSSSTSSPVQSTSPSSSSGTSMMGTSPVSNFISNAMKKSNHPDHKSPSPSSSPKVVSEKNTSKKVEGIVPKPLNSSGNGDHRVTTSKSSTEEDRSTTSSTTTPNSQTTTPTSSSASTESTPSDSPLSQQIKIKQSRPAPKPIPKTPKRDGTPTSERRVQSMRPPQIAVQTASPPASSSSSSSSPRSETPYRQRPHTVKLSSDDQSKGPVNVEEAPVPKD
eukprot:TRINITY_DN1115_c2_g1_i2.p1 TRINITY_DN1115_c2_g1~~TRINITY_DN1115_c2_g1_i2.p1  ORF type:complete len:1268 (-),score=402.69 TRINITY_DN1115_c2_g1_i2:241-4044(-)